MFLTDFIFKSYDENKALIKDISGINRWFTGEYSVDGSIREYYANNREMLYFDIENSYYKNASNFYSAADKIYKIVLCDTSISEGKKKELYKYYKKDKHNLSVFIAEVLIFSMCREKSKLKIKSPVADEMIVGCKANKPCKFFVDRDKEVEKLHNLIQDNNCVFVEGIGSIEKSKFVKKYIQLYKNKYTNIIYLRYNGNFKNMISNIQFVTDMENNDSEHRFLKYYNFLKSLRDYTLSVVDNFDTTIENESFFGDFTDNEDKVIFTTQSNFEDYECLQLDVIKDVVMAELEPKVTDCKDVINSIKSECIDYGSDKYYYLIVLKFVENMIEFIKIDDFEFFMSLFEQSFCYAEKCKELWIMRKIITVMRSYIKNENLLNIRYKALLYMFRAQYAVLRYANAYDRVAFIEKAIEIIDKNAEK